METQSPTRPPHVPKALFWDHRLNDFTTELDDPYLAGSRLHEGPDMIWVREVQFGIPAWMPTRQALIEEAYLSTDKFSSINAGDVAEMLGVTWRLIPLELDPPDHGVYRKILMPYFTPRAVGELEGAIREVCDSLIAAFENRGSCEFISEFALRFPSYIFLSLMGMPREMLPQFLAWEHTLFRGVDQMERIAAARAILAYLRSFVAEQRDNPKTELVKGILTGQVYDRPLNDDEIMGMCFLLYTGGLDTVYGSLGWYMRELARQPALQERLRAHPEDIPRAVDEFARAYGINIAHRRVTHDLEFHGVQMRKGDDIFLPAWLASRDPRAYENPHVIDINRQARNITFATGPHTCLGVHLAKRELRIMIETFITRFRNIRIPEGETYKYHAGPVFGVDYLPLVWDRC